MPVRSPRPRRASGLDVILRMCRHYDQLLTEYSAPKEGTQQLKFDTKYPKPMYAQFVAIFTKFMAAYWRMPGASCLPMLSTQLGAVCSCPVCVAPCLLFSAGASPF